MKKTINKMLLTFAGVFSLFGVLGCSQDVSDKSESSDSYDESERMPRPDPDQPKTYRFSSFSSFEDYLSKFCMQDYFIVTFDLTNVFYIGYTYYIVDTNHLEDSFIMDFENRYYFFTYRFSSVFLPHHRGIDNTEFAIKCTDILLVNSFNKSDVDFVLINEQDNELNYNLMLKDECIMKINITLSENYAFEVVEKMIVFLKDNIVILGGKPSA